MASRLERMMVGVEKNQRILIVDDSRENIQILMELLKNDYKVIAATNGMKALELAARDPQPDLILLDIMMPEMDGYEVCRHLKAMEKTNSIPVIFVTAMINTLDEFRGLELGAVDYIGKPIVPALTRVRIRNHLRLKSYQDNLLEMVNERTKKLQLIQSVMMGSLGTLAEYRDPETGGHIKRTQNYIKAIARQLTFSDRYRDQLTDDVIESIYISAPLHDIGKVGIPDAILLKPGPLSRSEFDKMKYHVQVGHDALSRAELSLGVDSFLRYARIIAFSHHEKWDGSGYPQGLAEEAIPLPGRLMALADVYDALISKRVYKDSYPHEEAVAMIVKGRGTHFDPFIVDAFLEIEHLIRNIALTYADFDEERVSLGGRVSRDLFQPVKDISRILLVEDNDINREVMRVQLENMGYRVEETANGAAAFEKFEENRFDLILTDLDMPQVNGYELAEKIKNANADVPIIAITASDFGLTSFQASQFGFSGYILKPFEARKFQMILGAIRDAREVNGK